MKTMCFFCIGHQIVFGKGVRDTWVLAFGPKVKPTVALQLHCKCLIWTFYRIDATQWHFFVFSALGVGVFVGRQNGTVDTSHDRADTIESCDLSCRCCFCNRVVSFAGLFHFEKHIGTTKWGPQPTPFQLLIAKVLTNHDRVKLPENIMIVCVCVCVRNSFFGRTQKETQWRKCFSLYAKPTPPPQKNQNPTVAGWPAALDFCMCPGLGSCWPWRRSALSTSPPGKRVSMAVPNVQKATVLPPNWWRLATRDSDCLDFLLCFAHFAFQNVG